MLIKTFEDLRLELEKNNGVMLLGQVAEEVYRAHEALSQSELKVVADKSPAHLRHQRRTQKRPTDAMKLGTAIHSALLEPETFEDHYIRTPKIDKRKKGGAEMAAAIETEAREMNKVVIADAQYETAIAAREALTANVQLSRMLRDGVSERACFGRIFGVNAKIKPDYYRPQDHAIVDLKSTKCASLGEFQRDVRNYRYHWQAVWYSDLIKEITGETPSFTILAVETSPPFCSAVFEIKFDLMAIARKEMQLVVDQIRRCMDTGDWHGYSTSVIELGAWPSEWSAYKKSLQAGA